MTRVLLASTTALVLCTAVVASSSLPLHFEQDSSGALVSRNRAYVLTLDRSGMGITTRDAQHRAASVTTTFPGARDTAPAGDGLSAARANYLIGADPAQWHTGAPMFDRAIYRDLYPGIDLVFYGSEGKLEYDFVVRPGSDPRRISMEIGGASRVRIDANGALTLSTAAGEIEWKKPVVYQNIAGVRHEVAGRFVRSGRRIRFALGAYDRKQELVIDPTLVYASYLGGSDNEGARGLAVDSSGNFYITGFTFSQNVPHTGGSLQPAYHGGTAFADIGGDAFVAKFNSSGALVYVTYLGGKSDDSGMAIAADSSGNAYVAGWTSSTDFPTTHGVFQSTFGGASTNAALGVSFGDAFVAKLNPSGNALVYSTYLGGSADDLAAAIAIDSAGNAYIGGATRSTNFPTKNPAQSSFKGAGGEPPLGPFPYLEQMGDGFVAKLSGDGSSLTYSTYLGGSLDDAVTAIAVDAAGNAYAGGLTVSKDFPTLAALQSTYGGGADVNSAQPVITTGDGFVSKFDSTGKLSYSTYLGGSSDDAVMGIAVDSTGAAYVTGFTSSANFPVTSNAAQKAFKGPATITGQRGFVWGDGFVAKLAASGNSLVYSTYLGGSGDDAGMAIALDGAGEAFVGGFSWSAHDFPISADALQKVWGGTQSGFTDPTGDGFVAKVSADGSTFVYSTYYGGSADEAVTGIALDSQGNVYFGGVTTSANLSTTSNAAQPKFAGEDPMLQTETLGDAFVGEISGLGASGAPAPVITAVVNAVSLGNALAPGTAVSLFGTNLPASASAGATVGGKAATVIFASSGQWSIVIPLSVPVGPTTIQIGNSVPFNITLAAYAPALVTNPPGSTTAAATHADSSLVTTTSPAAAGETITIFATGLGAVNSANAVTAAVSATIGGVSAVVNAAVLTQPGLYQVNVKVPQGLAGGNQNLVISVGGVNSPAVALPVAASGAAVPVITAVENGASYQAGIAPNSWITITGSNLSTVASDTWGNSIVNGSLPTSLDGVKVTVAGLPAYVEYVSPTQINAVAPDIPASAGSTVQVTVTNSLGVSAPVNAAVAAESPAFFLWPGGYAVATRQDYSLAVKNGTFSGVTTLAAKPGDVLILWGTGFGPSSPPSAIGVELPPDQIYYAANPVTVTFTPVGGGAAVSATVIGAALASSYAALYQVAIQVPASLAAGDYSVVATVAGVKSPATTLLTVQP